MKYRDVEKRLAELERQTAWRQAARERTPAHHEIDAVAVFDTLYEAGALPQMEDYPDEESWLAAVGAAFDRMHRSQFMPYAGGCGDPACDVCAA